MRDMMWYCGEGVWSGAVCRGTTKIGRKRELTDSAYRASL
jgi:hypothetical protein